MRNKEDNRANQAESSARTNIAFVMNNIKLLDSSSQGYARHLFNQSEPYHEYISGRGNKKHQLSDIEALYEKVMGKKYDYGTCDTLKEKYRRFQR